jgi:hypothetical protein
MDSLGRELAAGSDLWPTAEKEGWLGVGHWPLAGGGESRRPKGVRNPRNCRIKPTEEPQDGATDG